MNKYFGCCQHVDARGQGVLNINKIMFTNKEALLLNIKQEIFFTQTMFKKQHTIISLLKRMTKADRALNQNFKNLVMKVQFSLNKI